MDRATARKRAGELLSTVGMADWGDKKVSTYSKGMMQRVGLAQTLMSDPDLVVLDEPTDGVDPVGRRDIRDVLSRLREQGKTVFVNSHLLQELEMICERVAILVRGRVVKQGTIDDLTRAQQRYDIELAETDPAALAVLRPRSARGDPQDGGDDRGKDAGPARRRGPAGRGRPAAADGLCGLRARVRRPRQRAAVRRGRGDAGERHMGGGRGPDRPRRHDRPGRRSSRCWTRCGPRA